MATRGLRRTNTALSAVQIPGCW